MTVIIVRIAIVIVVKCMPEPYVSVIHTITSIDILQWCILRYHLRCIVQYKRAFISLFLQEVQKCTYTPRCRRCSGIAEHCVRRTCSRSLHSNCLRQGSTPHCPRYRLSAVTNRPPCHITGHHATYMYMMI